MWIEPLQFKYIKIIDWNALECPLKTTVFEKNWLPFISKFNQSIGAFFSKMWMRIYPLSMNLRVNIMFALSSYERNSPIKYLFEQFSSYSSSIICLHNIPVKSLFWKSNFPAAKLVQTVCFLLLYTISNLNVWGLLLGFTRQPNRYNFTFQQEFNRVSILKLNVQFLPLIPFSNESLKCIEINRINWLTQVANFS